MTLVGENPELWKSPLLWCAVVASVALVVVFFRHIKRADDPVMDYNLVHSADRYARIAQAMGVERGSMSEVEHAKAGVAAVRALVKEGGTPTLRELGVRETSVPPLVDYVMQDTFHLGLNPVPICPTRRGHSSPASYISLPLLNRRAWANVFAAGMAASNATEW